MTIRIRLVLALTLGIAITGIALAQDDQAAAPTSHHAPDPQKQLQRLTRRLQLTPDQTAKLQPILATRAQQLQALRADGGLSAPERRSKQRDIVRQADDQLQAVLSDRQRQQYLQRRDQMKQRRQQRSSPSAPAPASSGG